MAIEPIAWRATAPSGNHQRTTLFITAQQIADIIHTLQGHVRIGPEAVTDPAFLVTRNMEDFVTWVDTSKIKRKVQKFNEVRAVQACPHSDSLCALLMSSEVL